MDRDTEAWVATEQYRALSGDDPAVRDSLLRQARRYEILESALARTGHTAERADHHALVCPLCTALRAAEEVDRVNTRDHPAGDDSREADSEQRERPA